MAQQSQEKNKGKRMPYDRGELFELYSIAMDEVRHQHRMYTETWIAGIFMTSAFFAGLYFLSDWIPTKPFLAATFFKLFVIILGCAVMVSFYWIIRRRGVIVDTCREIAKKLEDILASKRKEEAVKLDNLLLTHKIEERLKKRRDLLRLIARWQPWFVFLLALLTLWILLCNTVLTVN